jgi:hypothetical protein
VGARGRGRGGGRAGGVGWGCGQGTRAGERAGERAGAGGGGGGGGSGGRTAARQLRAASRTTHNNTHDPGHPTLAPTLVDLWRSSASSAAVSMPRRTSPPAESMEASASASRLTTSRDSMGFSDVRSCTHRHTHHMRAGRHKPRHERSSRQEGTRAQYPRANDSSSSSTTPNQQPGRNHPASDCPDGIALAQRLQLQLHLHLQGTTRTGRGHAG